MGKRNFFLGVLFFVLIMNAVCGISFAGEETMGDYFREIGTKFGRGLWNVISSPAEIPCTMVEDTKNQGSEGVFTGFGKGIVFMLRRILVGVTEVGTFVIPMERTIPQVCHH